MSGDNRAEVVIDLSAYRRNLVSLRKALGQSELMAVVKSDAYGHGLLPVARTAVDAGVTHLGALDIATGLKLRAAGIVPPVAILVWLHTPSDDFAAAIDAEIDIGISTIEELQALISADAHRRARIHLKIDTGLHRNGANEADWPQLVRAAVTAHDAGAVELHGVWTHISETSDSEDTAAIDRFVSAVSIAEALGARFSVRHLAASAAGLMRSDSRFDLVRMGAFTLGISPGGGVTADALGLEPVMTLRSRVERVEVSDDTRVAVIPLGYGDGLLGECAGRVDVAIRGHRHTISKLEVDQMTVALARDDVLEGDAVTLFGSGTHGESTLEEWADALGTIGEELVVRLSPTLVRHYLVD